MQQYYDLSNRLGQLTKVDGQVILHTARLNAAWKQYSMALATPEELNRVITQITQRINNMKFRIQITPKGYVDAEDQKWWEKNSPRFVGESELGSLKGDVQHSRSVPESHAYVFDTIEEANEWLAVLVTDKTTNYEIVPA